MMINSLRMTLTRQRRVKYWGTDAINLEMDMEISGALRGCCTPKVFELTKYVSNSFIGFHRGLLKARM